MGKAFVPQLPWPGPGLVKIAAGVPANAITCDYAGFRTLDSVLRAQSVFGLKNFTIVTEEFHCPRALWIMLVPLALATDVPNLSPFATNLRKSTG